MNEVQLTNALAGIRRGAAGAAEDAADRFTRAADEAGLADVVYGREDSPIGPLAIAATRRGLVKVAFLAGGRAEDEVVAELAVKVSPRVLEGGPRLERPRRELHEYFAGTRRRFELPVDWRLVRGFNRDVLRVTSRIGYGDVASYTEVAARAGSARAYRAAGNALNRNPVPIVVPCHRVLHSSGGLGGYGGGLDAKRFLLELERGSAV